MSASELQVPVVLLVFARPECTARMFAVVKSARPARLWVVADGARPDRVGEAERVAAVRALIEDGIDWPCEVHRIYSETNLGCARRVSSGLDAVFAVEEEAIILEDDCVPDPTFFRFCGELLERYRMDPRVAVVAGDNFQGGAAVTSDSYYFSRYPHCWGWATWRRAWREYDHAMTAWPRLDADDSFRRAMSSPAEARYWRNAFEATRAGTLDSWANRWTLACWAHDRLTVLPSVNLVSNIGFDACATHTRAGQPGAALPVESMQFPLRHPAEVTSNSAADARTARMFFHRSTAPQRLFAKIRRRFFRARIPS